MIDLDEIPVFLNVLKIFLIDLLDSIVTVIVTASWHPSWHLSRSSHARCHDGCHDRRPVPGLSRCCHDEYERKEKNTVPLHRKYINGLKWQKLRTSTTGLFRWSYSVNGITPRFHGIKRYFKHSRNSPWVLELRCFTAIAPLYRIYHWITFFYSIYHGIAPFI